MNALIKKIGEEPIGFLGLLVAVIALVPSYLSLIADQNYQFSFHCSEIGSETEAVVVDGGVHRDFVAVRAHCDFSNLDDQTISIKSSHAFASFESFSDVAIEFPRPLEAKPEGVQFNVLAKDQAYAVAAGETLLFDEFYMVPIDRNWAENETLCEGVEYDVVSTFQEIANCVPDLRRECFSSYLSGMNFWTGAGGQTPYRALAIRLTLGDNTYARAPLKTAWYWKPFPDSRFYGSNCPDPDKTN